MKYIIIHHLGGTQNNPLADTSNQTFETVNDYHRRKWNFKSKLGYYLGYTYFIDKKGIVTQARKDDEIGAHTIGYNDKSIGIVLAGNFDVTVPTIEQINALRSLLNRKVKEYAVSAKDIVPHRHFASKSCYGKLLSDDWARNLISPVSEEVGTCQNERYVIIEKEKQIGNLQKLVSWLISFYNK